MSASLLAESHELSRIWKDKQTYMETEEMKLKELAGFSAEIKATR